MSSAYQNEAEQFDVSTSIFDAVIVALRADTGSEVSTGQIIDYSVAIFARQTGSKKVHEKVGTITQTGDFEVTITLKGGTPIVLSWDFIDEFTEEPIFMIFDVSYYEEDLKEAPALRDFRAKLHRILYDS